jgi:hypothetical protein
MPNNQSRANGFLETEPAGLSPAWQEGIMPLSGAWTGALTQPATGAMVRMIIPVTGTKNQ